VRRSYGCAATTKLKRSRWTFCETIKIHREWDGGRKDLRWAIRSRAKLTWGFPVNGPGEGRTEGKCGPPWGPKRKVRASKSKARSQRVREKGRRKKYSPRKFPSGESRSS